MIVSPTGRYRQTDLRYAIVSKLSFLGKFQSRALSPDSKRKWSILGRIIEDVLWPTHV